MADVPIIPVGISGGTRAWPKGRGPKAFEKVRVKIGKPWYVPKPEEEREYTYEELKELSRYLLFDLIEPLWNKSMERSD
jgi:1-acyl-sn-glycerol-3-phosphate acyltransferase